MVEDFKQDLISFSVEMNEFTLEEMLEVYSIIKAFSKRVDEEICLRDHASGRSSRRLIDGNGVDHHRNPIRLNTQG